MPDISSQWGNLSTGPAYIRAFEENISNPIVGSREELNSPVTGSPFTIRILLPEILERSFVGKGISVPRGLFDPLLEELNEQNILSGQDELGTRVSTSSNIGIVDTALKKYNNFGKVKTRQENFRQSSFVVTENILTNLRKIVYGNGEQLDPSGVNRSEANQTALTDITQALSVVLQANDIIRAPALQLLINPNNFVITYNKKQDYSSRIRTGYTFQAWGEDQPRLSVNGRIGSFLSGNTTNTGVMSEETTTVSGNQWNSRQDSAAFQNLMNLFILYQNNAHIYDVIGGSEAHLWTGNVEIMYDQKVYLGNFENFNYGYEETQQRGGLIYSFNFVVSREYDLQRPGPILPIGGPGFESSLNPSTAVSENTSDQEEAANGTLLFGL